MKDTTKNRKVFILGLDGATFDIINPMVERGELPNMAKMIREGVSTKLESTLLHHSPPAWTSFSTGKNPGKHGILGFTQIASDSYKLNLVYGSHNRAKPMWEMLGNQGKKVIVMNIPMSYPPKPVNGILLSGLDAPSTEVDFTHPKEIKKEILEIAPDYKINLHLGGYLNNNKRRIKAIDIMKDAISARLKVVLYLMNKYPWDLFVVRFNSPDNVQHQFWNFMDEKHPEHRSDSPSILKNAISGIYSELDQVLAKIYEQIDADSTNFIIMSDHGAGPRSGKSIYVNEWLKGLGHISRTGENGIGSERTVKKRVNECKHFVKEKLLGLLLRNLSPKIKSKLMHYIPFAAGMTATFLRFSGIDWERTKVFVGEVEGIRINLEGKYPKGIVKPEDYETIRERVITEAKKLIDPQTGKNVFKAVLKKEEAFWGDHMGNLPDIILLPEDRYYISPKFFRTGEKDTSLLKNDAHWRKISGSHRLHGIFIMKGPDCLAGKELQEMSIMDICPSVLYQLGVEIPDDLDGKVVEAAFTDKYRTAHPIRFVESAKYQAEEKEEVYSEQEASEIKESLKSLGYIDD